MSIFQLSAPLYPIRASDPETPLSLSYEHAFFWQLGVGYVRVLEIDYRSNAFVVLTIPKRVAEKIEARYAEIDGEFWHVAPWPEVGLAACMRTGTRLKGKKPSRELVSRVLKTELKDILLEDTDINIDGLARTLNREAAYAS